VARVVAPLWWRAVDLGQSYAASSAHVQEGFGAMAVKRRSFAQARRAAGYTQESLAERLGVDRTTVARWESGEYSPQPWLRPKIAHALGLSLRELSELVDGMETTGSTGGVSTSLVRADGVPVSLAGAGQVSRVPVGEVEHDRLCRAMELVGAYAETTAPRTTTGLPQVPWNTDQLAVLTAHAIVAGFVKATGVEPAEGLGALVASLACVRDVTETIPAEWEDRLRDELKHMLGEWVHTVNRRTLLGLVGWAAATVAAAPVTSLDPDEQQRVIQALAVPSRVDATVIDHIAAMLQHCKRQEDALGPRAVLQTVLAQRHLVDALLTECPDSLRPRLLSVYSSISSSVAIYCFDLDDRASAMHYGDQARKAAQEAHNTELAIYALCMMSHFASRHGTAHTGIDFAAAAQNLAGKTDDVLLQVCIAERFASAYGLDGQYKESMAEFDRASEGLALPAGRRSPESPVYWFTEGLIASRQSDCLLRQNKPAEAAASAQSAVQLFDDSFIRDFAFCTLTLGTARLRSGEIEEAARVIGEGTLLAARIQSVRLVNEVRAVRAQLEPWKGTRAVRELDERLLSYGVVASY
jgi:DNA-binding XRE family transcriptional regulator